MSQMNQGCSDVMLNHGLAQHLETVPVKFVPPSPQFRLPKEIDEGINQDSV